MKIEFKMEELPTSDETYKKLKKITYAIGRKTAYFKDHYITAYIKPKPRWLPDSIWRKVLMYFFRIAEFKSTPTDKE